MDFELNRSFGLSIREEGSFSSRSELAWEDFAIASGADDNDPRDGRSVAGLLNRGANLTFAPSDIYRRLVELTGFALGPDPGDIKDRLSELTAGLNQELLAQAIKSEQNLILRQRGLNKISDVVDPAAILALTRATAEAFSRPLSPVLLTLLEKLSREARELEPPLREIADHSFRDLYKEAVETWVALSTDHNVVDKKNLPYDRAPSVPGIPASRVAPRPEHVFSLALETGAVGTVLWNAVDQMTESDEGVRRILAMLKDAPRNSQSAALVAQKFATPDRLGMLLREEPVDFKAVDGLLAGMGVRATVPLLDALADAGTRTTRRGILDRLARIGPDVGTEVIMRLKSDERWYVQRNMFTVLREAKCDLKDVPLERYTNQGDARVRREAMQLRLADPLDRDKALTAALRSTDAGMMKIGLRAARVMMSDGVAPVLSKRVVEPDFPAELRGPALHVLARANSTVTLDAFLKFASSGTSLLGKPKLAAKSPEMLAALGGLARRWPTEKRAARIIEMAKASKDPDIINAVAGDVRPAFEEVNVDDE